MNKSIFISLLTIFQLSITFLFQIFILNIFGISSDVDIYLSSNTINYILVGVASGAINYALTPELIKLRVLCRYKQLVTLINSIVNIIFIFFLIFAMIQFYFSNNIATILFPGFSDDDNILLGELLAIQAFISIVSVLIGVLNSINYTFNNIYRTILSPIVAGLLQIIFVYYTFEQYGIYSLVYALALNQLFIFATLGYGYFSYYKVKIIFNRKLTHVYNKIAPLFVSATFSKSDILVNRYFASMLDAGSIVLLHYGLLFISTISTVVDKGVSIVTLRKFSLIDSHNIEEFNLYFKNTYKIMLYVTMIMTAFIVVFSDIVLEFIFSDNKFNKDQVETLYYVVISFLGVFVGGVLSSVLVNAFYSKGLTAIVSKMSIAVQAVAIPVKILFFHMYGFFALVLVTSFHYLVTFILLIILYDKYIHQISYIEFGRVFVFSFILGLITIYGLIYMKELIF
jgi:putative peptidoglycan lipid II flippase